MGEVTRYTAGGWPEEDGEWVRYSDYLAALAEGARQERERIRGLELDENVRGLLKGVMHAIHHMPWSTSAWRALLAAITQASEANTHDGAAVTEGE